MRERIISLDKNTYAIFRIESPDPFGGITRRGFGWEAEYGSTGCTYDDPRPRMRIELNLLLWNREFSARFLWRGRI